MAQLTIRIPEGGLGVRQGARLPTGGGGITVGGGMLPGPPQIQPQDPQVAAAPWLGLKKGADAVTAWAEAAIKADAAASLSNATTEAAKQLASLQGDMLQAPEARTLEGARALWTARTTEIRDSVGGNLSGAARASFNNSFGELEASRRFNVERDAFQRQMQAETAGLQDNLAGLADQAAAARNPAERDTLLAQGADLIRRSAEAGLVNPERSSDIARRFQQQVAVGTARRLIVENPAAAVTLLRDPGQLRGLTPARRYQMLDQAIRAQRRGGGGLGVGAGPADDDVPDLPPAERQSLLRQGEAQALAEDAATLRGLEAAERTGFAQATAMGREAVDQWFTAAADAGGAVAMLPERADLMPAAIVMAANTVIETGGAGADDPASMSTLAFGAGSEDPEAFASSAADEVTAGRITPGAFARLTQSNRDLMADTPAAAGWRRARGDAAAMVEPPDMADLGVPAMDDVRATAMMEMDAWRGANPAATRGEADRAAREIAVRHRQAMADRAAATLPRLPALGQGPYRPEALDEVEMDTLAALDAGEIAPLEAARRLRVTDAWRWVGEDVAPERGP